MVKKVNIGIIGGSGYTGLELLKILCRHQYSDISFITSRSNSGKKVEEILPSIRDVKFSSLIFKAGPLEEDYKNTDIIFLCLPPHSSMDYIKKMGMAANFKIIDIGSDFRKYYKFGAGFKMMCATVWFGYYFYSLVRILTAK